MNRAELHYVRSSELFNNHWHPADEKRNARIYGVLRAIGVNIAWQAPDCLRLLFDARKLPMDPNEMVPVLILRTPVFEAAMLERLLHRRKGAISDALTRS